MKEVRKNYINDKIKMEKWQYICVFFLVISISGVFGWIYEFILYYFNGGMKEIYLQGGNFLPWINIYAIGSVLIVLTTKRIKKNPLLLFIVSTIVTGLLELVSGYVLYKYFNYRFWNYNVEILNFGNIGGFICLRSVLFFGLSALFLIYYMIPFCINIIYKSNKKTIVIISTVIFSLIMIDELYNLIITKIFNLPSAIEIYQNLGFKYTKL